MTKRTGRLTGDRCYLTWIMKDNIPGNNVNYWAPAGSIIEWAGEKTDHPEYYGGRDVHWCYLPQFGGASIGLVPGEDFEWDNEED